MSVKELAQAFRDAEREYQFALASGDMKRLKVAKANKSATFSEYRKAKIAQLKENDANKAIQSE